MTRDEAQALAIRLNDRNPGIRYEVRETRPPSADVSPFYVRRLRPAAGAASSKTRTRTAKPTADEADQLTFDS
jgi:hypothetical protein